jgi:hypothetical protein
LGCTTTPRSDLDPRSLEKGRPPWRKMDKRPLEIAENEFMILNPGISRDFLYANISSFNK